MKNTLSLGFFIFLTLGYSHTGTTQVANSQSDESGTLVLAARTQTAVIISVDSKISRMGPGAKSFAQDLQTDSARKLVDVGSTGACALDGYLGVQGSKEFDIATALRAWVKKNPKVTVDRGLEGLLVAAESAWNKRNFRNVNELPGSPPRKPGDVITTLICGDLVTGRPEILRGATFVQNDLSARHETLKPVYGDLFYAGGMLETDAFIVFASNPNGQLSHVTPDIKKFYLNVFSDVKSNFAGGIALGCWEKEMIQVETCMRINPRRAASSCPLSQWTNDEVKALFDTIFSSVERLASDNVGPPNQARVITQCGRETTTVEAPEWKVCSVSPTQSTKSH